MTRHAADRRPEPAGQPAGRTADDPIHADLAGPDLANIEAAVRARWAAAEVPSRCLASAATSPAWTCWSEPQAAAGLPGVHDMPAHALSDTYQRLRTMQGFSVHGGSGVSCHGMAVEVAVERELGLPGHSGIEAYGVGRFTARCHESAMRHGAAFSDLNARLGCWQAEPPEITMDPRYVESVWWSLRRLFEAGLLGRHERVTPYCPRCQTPLSAQDLNQPGSRCPAANTGVIVRFKLASLPDGANPRLRGADLLAWTTRPWTLAGNSAVAVHPHQTYALARRAGHDDSVIVAEARLAPMLGEDWHVAAQVRGSDLAGATYHPVLGLTAGTRPHPVIAGYFVLSHSGTGLMPLAPAYGSDDLEATRTHNLAVLDPLGADGRFGAEVPLIGGAFFADADAILIAALADAGALVPPVRPAEGEACWRCGTPLLRRAMRAWYLRTSAGWPEDDADWMISRSRYWGTPLPLWECPEGHVTCVESLAQLSELAGMNLVEMDPHRPRIDEVVIACPHCDREGRRVPYVLDARYDASWLPFARRDPAVPVVSSPGRPQHGLIIGSAGQAGGWAGAVRQIGSMVHGRPPAFRVLQVEPVLDASGRAMSRGLGNVVEPLPLIERYGSDVIRWFCVAAGSAERGLALSEAALDDIIDRVFAPYWKAATALLRWLGTPGDDAPQAELEDADQSLAGELHSLVTEVTSGFEELKPARSAARIAEFINVLVNGYLPAAERTHGSARPATLRTCMDTLTRLMAPIAPFVTDEVWSRLLGHGALAGQPESVHLATWPSRAPELTLDQPDGDLQSWS